MVGELAVIVILCFTICYQERNDHNPPNRHNDPTSRANGDPGTLLLQTDNGSGPTGSIGHNWLVLISGIAHTAKIAIPFPLFPRPHTHREQADFEL